MRALALRTSVSQYSFMNLLPKINLMAEFTRGQLLHGYESTHNLTHRCAFCASIRKGTFYNIKLDMSLAVLLVETKQT